MADGHYNSHRSTRLWVRFASSGSGNTMIVGQYLTRNKARPEDTLHDRLYAWASRWWLGPRNTLTSGPGKGHGYRRGNWHAGSWRDILGTVLQGQIRSDICLIRRRALEKT